ncbi:MAG: nucleoside triphosphate pyrophosphohydrolase [Oscillospiraceae bacterium]|nr:nucleoside triphosphate pyrophosphohydrolase [Oscillospiraceae bacterium]
MADAGKVAGLLSKKHYSANDLLAIVELLRAPGGCPWDAEQTHQSIKKNFIEETYEAIEAINRADDTLLCEELGDVLLQVALHCQIAAERESFTWEQVTDGVCRKLVERHPHVFGAVQVAGVDDVRSNWDTIKRRSKGQGTVTDAMEHIPRELPALMRGTKLQQKAARAGFDWPDASGALDRLAKEVGELREAVAQGVAVRCREELGDVLFSAANVARFLQDCDAEEAMSAANEKFLRRFATAERMALAEGFAMKSAPSAELDRLWEAAKKEDS